jgi:hypothetical protein
MKANRMRGVLTKPGQNVMKKHQSMIEYAPPFAIARR